MYGVFDPDSTFMERKISSWTLAAGMIILCLLSSIINIGVSNDGISRKRTYLPRCQFTFGMGAFNGLGWQAFKKPGIIECLRMAFFPIVGLLWQVLLEYVCTSRRFVLHWGTTRRLPFDSESEREREFVGRPV